MSAPILLWFSPNVFGASVIERSIGHGLVERSIASALVRWDGRSAPPEAPSAAVLVSAGLTSDLRAVSEALRFLAGLVPADRILRVLCGNEPASVSEARESFGERYDSWPADPRTVADADRRAVPLRVADPRSRLSQALESIVETLAAMRPLAPEALDPDIVARAVADRVWRALEAGGVDGVDRVIEEELSTYLSGSPGVLATEEKETVRRRLRQELTGFGPIEPFFEDPAVSEIMVNGAERIFVERGGRVERAPTAYLSEDRLRLAISRIVSPTGRRVDLSSPLCDVRLPDGSRANVVLPPVSVGGPVLTVRRFRPAFNHLDDLIRAGAVTEEQAAVLARAVADRRNLLVAGNSGAGKTTLLNALAGLIPDEERIITMEDAAELKIRKPHVVRLETRPPNAEGTGEITMRDLVINALRMRPDRLVIGECRGAEAVPMLQAMNTGHDGSMTTLHANSAADALDRLESMVLIGAPHWPSDVVRRQIFAAVHLVAFLRRAGGVRRLESIVPIEDLRR